MSNNPQDTTFSNNNNYYKWVDNLNLAITVSDLDNNIIYMNEKSKATFANTTIGNNLENCHKPASNALIQKMKLENISNTYTIQKNGIKKIIHQTPWYVEEKVAGLVEFSIEIPFEIPHKNRDSN